ncbi:MAG: sulfotransferase family protein [Actinomycetia bacterium]|nr:sulfotransferase family protein [Actinomycetes bacterium]
MSASLTSAANALNASERRSRDCAPAASFVVPDLKIAYVTNLKAACSAMKWLIADLTEQDPERFHRSIGRRPTRAQTVHDRAGWVGVSHLADYPNLSKLSAAKGWFVFGLVRDPRARLWSAWQSKLLVGNPNYLGKPVVKEPWYPRLPRDASDVIEDFHRFVEVLAARGRRMHRVGNDGHFRAQSDLLYRHNLEYTAVYDLAEIPTFERDLAAHLIEVGHNTLPALRRENDTPLKLTKDVLAGGIAETIADIYREDFDRFGSAWEEGPTVHEVEWESAAFADIAFRRAAHQRIRDLSTQAGELAREVEDLRQAQSGVSGRSR